MAGAGESCVLAIEKLTGMSNYNSWAYAMQMYLIHEDLWDYVTEDMADSKNYSAKNDKKTLSKIVLMIKPELYPYTKKANTAKEAWEALRETFVPSDTSGKRSLLKKLFTASLQDYSSMETYINGVMSIVQKLADLEYNVDDELVAYVLLNGLPASYEALVMALDSCGKKLTPALVKARLMAEDVRRVENKMFLYGNVPPCTRGIKF